MKVRGSIKATRLEPETGRLQYLVEHVSGLSQWHYASDPKFNKEFSGLIKKFINAEPGHREVRKRPAERSHQNMPLKRQAAEPMRNTKQDSGSTSSEVGSVGRLVETRIPVGNFRRLRSRAAKKLAAAKVRAATADSSSWEGSAIESKWGSVSSKKRTHSPDSAARPKVNRRVSPSASSASSKSRASNNVGDKTGQNNNKSQSLHERMRQKILLERSKQVVREKHRLLLNGLSGSTAKQLKPVSMNMNRDRNQSLLRSQEKPRVNGLLSDLEKNSSRAQMLRKRHAAIRSFLAQSDNSCNGESSEAASTSTSSNKARYSSSRRAARRQAANAQLSQQRFSQVVLRHRPGWTQVWLFTTSRMQNAFSPQVCDELKNAIKACIDDSDTSLILISSSGPTFSSGIDLHYLLDAKDTEAAARRLAQSLTELCQVLVACPKPIFVAVNGPCIGFGVALCCLADVVIATEKASFSTPYAKLGHVPEGGLSTTLQDAVGRAMANDMLLTGRRLTAVEALRAGLVSRVLWPANFVQELHVRLDVVASSMRPALEATKLLMRSASTSNNEDAVSGTLSNVNRLPVPAAVLHAVEAERGLSELFWNSPASRAAMRRYIDSA